MVFSSWLFRLVGSTQLESKWVLCWVLADSQALAPMLMIELEMTSPIMKGSNLAR